MKHPQSESLLREAQHAWEKTSQQWRCERLIVGGIVYKVALTPDEAIDPETEIFMRFDSYEAAQMFKREKIISAILKSTGLFQ